jgi:hypothetical protein
MIDSLLCPLLMHLGGWIRLEPFQTGSNRNQAFEAVVANGEVFEIPTTSNEAGSVSPGTYGRFLIQLSLSKSQNLSLIPPLKIRPSVCV